MWLYIIQQWLTSASTLMMAIVMSIICNKNIFIRIFPLCFLSSWAEKKKIPTMTIHCLTTWGKTMKANQVPWVTNIVWLVDSFRPQVFTLKARRLDREGSVCLTRTDFLITDCPSEMDARHFLLGMLQNTGGWIVMRRVTKARRRMRECMRIKWVKA